MATTNSTQWEYLVVICGEGFYPKIDFVNQEPLEIEEQVDGFFGRKLQKRKPYLHEYLQEIGKDGWEVCGMSPINTSLDGNLLQVCVILKRPSQK